MNKKLKYGPDSGEPKICHNSQIVVELGRVYSSIAELPQLYILFTVHMSKDQSSTKDNNYLFYGVSP